MSFIFIGSPQDLHVGRSSPDNMYECVRQLWTIWSLWRSTE